MNTKAELLAYLVSIEANARIIEYFTRMSEERAALFLTLRCNNTQEGVSQQLIRFQQ